MVQGKKRSALVSPLNDFPSDFRNLLSSHLLSEIPTYILLALSVCHLLSSSSSLSLSLSDSISTLSSHLPNTIQGLLPLWSKHGRKLNNLARFSTDLPNSSNRGGSSFARDQIWPFRSEALGFGHPLTTLHNFTRACLGLSYPIVNKNFRFNDGGFGTYLDHSNHATGLINEEIGLRNLELDSWTWLLPSSSFTSSEGGELFYSKGPKDALYVLTWILIFTALRAGVIKFLLIPLGEKVVVSEESDKVKDEKKGKLKNGYPNGNGMGIEKDGMEETTHKAGEIERIEKLKARRAREKDVLRFAEQAWSVIYYVVYWSIGLVSSLDLRELARRRYLLKPIKVPLPSIFLSDVSHHCSVFSTLFISTLLQLKTTGHSQHLDFGSIILI